MRTLTLLLSLFALPVFGDYLITYDQSGPDGMDTLLQRATDVQDLNAKLSVLESDISISGIKIGVISETYDYTRQDTFDVIELDEFMWVMKYEITEDGGATWVERAIVYEDLDEITRKKWDEDATAIEDSPNQRLIDNGCLHYLKTVNTVRGSKITFILPSQ